MDALKSLPPDFTCFTVETEFWGQNPSPNLMVELSAQHVADLITALTFHVGEVRRNPYHLSLPLDDRQCAPRGGAGRRARRGCAGLTFATLYRLRKWSGSKLENIYGRRTISGLPGEAGEFVCLTSVGMSRCDVRGRPSGPSLPEITARWTSIELCKQDWNWIEVILHRMSRVVISVQHQGKARCSPAAVVT